MADRLAKAKATELCAVLDNDRAKAEAVVGYITSSMLYDHLKARTVRQTYKPNPDATVAAQRGICWDFATLVKTMLTSQGVGCRLVIGWADQAYHAWNEVELDGEWTLYDVTSTIIGLPTVRYLPKHVL